MHVVLRSKSAVAWQHKRVDLRREVHASLMEQDLPTEGTDADRSFADIFEKRLGPVEGDIESAVGFAAALVQANLRTSDHAHMAKLAEMVRAVLVSLRHRMLVFVYCTTALHFHPTVFNFHTTVLYNHPTALYHITTKISLHTNVFHFHPIVLSSHPTVFYVNPTALHFHPTAFHFHPTALHFQTTGMHIIRLIRSCMRLISICNCFTSSHACICIFYDRFPFPHDGLVKSPHRF